MGNPIIWWTNLVFLAVFFWTLIIDAVRRQRSGEENNPNSDRTLTAGLWLLLGWGLHYIPFWAMGRVLYFHHYFPALLYSSMLTAVVFDFFLKAVTGWIGSRVSQAAAATVFHGVLAAVVGALAYR